MRRTPLSALLLVVALAALAVPAGAAPKPLDAAIEGIVGRSPVGDAASVAVRDGEGALIAAVRPTTPRLPASNQKVATILVALEVLGPQGRLPTALVAATEPVDGVVRGDLWLVGGGDPTFSTDAFADRWYGIYTPTPDSLAARLREAGVRRVTGRLLGDASAFDAAPGAPGWKPSFIPSQSPPISALTIDRAAADPALRATRVVRRALVRAGIAIGPARVASAPAPSSGVELAVVRSAPVGILAELAGRDSDNFVAEMLLRAAARAETGTGSTAAGVGLARRLLRERDVPLQGVVLADGSGLSYDNRATAAELSLLLARVDDDPDLGPVMREALALAGVDGTLAARMRRGPAKGLVQAKTGTLNDASALSGYAGDCAFSVLVQRSWVDQAAAHALQDAIAQLVAKRRAAC